MILVYSVTNLPLATWLCAKKSMIIDPFDQMIQALKDLVLSKQARKLQDALFESWQAEKL